MSGYLAFTKKEITENTRNYRLLAMLGMFIVLGISSPLLAKMMPQLMAVAMPNLTEALKPPVALDSWDQFFKNVSQLGLSLTIILFSNCLSGEYAKGTLVIMLTKGLSRPSVILSKYTVAAITFSASYWLSFGISLGYTAFLWPGATTPHTVLAAFAIWLSGMFYLSVLMLGGVLFRQAFASVFFLLGVTALVSVLGMIDLTAAYTPAFLISRSVDLLSGEAAIADFIAPIVITAVLSVVLLASSVLVFNKKQL